MARAGWTTHGPYAPVADLVVSRDSPGTVYAGTDAGLYASSDSGASWNNLMHGNVQAVAIDEASSATLYAFANHLWKSADGGVNWTVVDSDYENGNVCAMLSVGSTLFLGDCYSGLFHTMDDGMITAVGGALDGVGVNAIASDPRVGFFVATYNGIYGGTERTFLADCPALAIDPDRAIVYAAGRNAVYRSTDYGGTWTDMGLGAAAVQALAVDRFGDVYVGTRGSGVFRHTNGSWTAFNTGLTDADVRALAFEPAAPYTLHAATAGGVFSIQDEPVCADGCLTPTPTEVPTGTPTPIVPTPTATDIAVCAGDCGGTSSVAIDDLIMLVNIALGNQPRSACSHGISSGADVDVSLLVEAVTNAVNGCSH